MPNVFEFDGVCPVVHPSAFIHPNATVTGYVTIGRDVYIGPGAALRGDWGAIEIADGCNVQENCVIHAFPGVTVVLEAAAHVGHGAIIHGAPSAKTTVVVRGRPNPLQAAGRDAGLKLMEIKRLRTKGHRITLLNETQFWRLVGKR